MKLASIAAACALALSAAGCGTVTGQPAPTAASLQLDAAKARYSFEAIFKAADEAYLDAAPFLTPADKVKAKAIAADLYTALKAARSAQAVGDAKTLAAQVAAVSDLAAQLLTLVHEAHPPMTLGALARPDPIGDLIASAGLAN